VHGKVVLAGPVALDGDPARPDRRRERRVDVALEVEDGAPVGEAVGLEPPDPARVAGVGLELVPAALGEPRDKRVERGPGVDLGVRQHGRAAALRDRGIAGHVSVALEDRPGPVLIDELARLLRGHPVTAGPGRVLGQRERHQVGTVSWRGGAENGGARG
jgi:hypothetical protein